MALCLNIPFTILVQSAFKSFLLIFFQCVIIGDSNVFKQGKRIYFTGMSLKLINEKHKHQLDS